MTLPKGYKPNTPSRDDDDDRPTGRPRKEINKRKLAWGIILLIITIFGLIATYYNVLDVIQAGKELDDQKKVVAKAKIEYEEAFKDVYGRYPSPSEYPH